MGSADTDRLYMCIDLKCFDGEAAYEAVYAGVC